jgi:hypothetical protein
MLFASILVSICFSVGVPRSASVFRPRERQLTYGQQLAAMQETLAQLSDLNNEAIAESSRTAQKLTGDDWVEVGGKADGGS